MDECCGWFLARLFIAGSRLKRTIQEGELFLIESKTNRRNGNVIKNYKVNNFLIYLFNLKVLSTFTPTKFSNGILSLTFVSQSSVIFRSVYTFCSFSSISPSNASKANVI